MATEAARLECKEFRKNKEKTHLTHTGLLMEGVRVRADQKTGKQPL
jgi:hypothetical protein